MRKILSAVLCVAVIALCTAGFTMSAADGHISLFVEDSVWERDTLMPMIEYGGKILLPVSAFGAVEGITVVVSEALGSVLISRGDEYVSFSLGMETVLDSGNNKTKVSIYRYDGEIYVEPEVVCEKLSLSFETEYAPDGFLSARLTAGAGTLSLTDLLSVYSEKTDDTGRVFLTNVNIRTYEGQFVHPIIISPAVTSVAKLIELCQGHKVTFALEPANISSYGDALCDIYASGNGVAYFMSSEYLNAPDVFTAKVRSANAYLYTLIGKTVRTYVSTELYSNIPDIDGFFKKSCRANLVADDISSDRMLKIMLSEISDGEANIFSLSSDHETRLLYAKFFSGLDEYATLRTMPLSESGANR